MKKRLIQLLSLALILIISLSVFAGCSKKEANLVNEDGSYNLEALKSVTVSKMRRQNGRSVIYYKNNPYLYYAMHLRIDHLRETNDEDIAKMNFETYAKQVKADGWDTIIVYIKWSRIYDGKKYDFSDLEYQYSIAKKYDLKVHLNWFGYDVCGYGGYMPWQEGDLEKYPCLSGMDGSPLINEHEQYIPDFSEQIYLDESYDAIQQVCAWLYVNDTDRRTVAIQLENEPDNSEGGNGLWMSQFTNIANHLNNLGKAVKESPYSMVTYLNLMNAGLNTEIEGFDIKGRIHHLIDKEYIDIVGWDLYTNVTTPRYKNIEYGKNMPLFAEMGICAYSVPGQINYSFSNGYGIGFYLFVNTPDTEHNNGFYSYKDDVTGLQKRDGTQIVPENPIDTMGGKEELKTDEVININKSIKAIRELIATERTKNITVFNNNMKNVVSTVKVCNKQKITYICNYPDEKYGSSGLCIGAGDGNFYLYSSQDAQYQFESTIKEVTAGTYSDGEWTSSGTVEVKNNTFDVKAGLAYRVVIE